MKFDLSHSIKILETSPKTIEVLLNNLPEEWIHTNEGENTWSPFDVVGHIIHGEKTDWIPRAKIIIEKGEAEPFKPFDRFAQLESSKGKTLEQLLIEFLELREKNIQELKSLNITAETLLKTGIHPEFGRVTLKQHLATWTIHDLSHINQIARVLTRNYKEAVGPWKAYIPLLK